MRPPAADDERGHEKIEQLAEPLHEGRNDERTERCRSSTRGLAALFAREAEAEVKAQGDGSEQDARIGVGHAVTMAAATVVTTMTKQATPRPASHDWQRRVTLLRKENQAYLRFSAVPSF